jgi:hypothetical protein
MKMKTKIERKLKLYYEKLSKSSHWKDVRKKKNNTHDHKEFPSTLLK